MLSSQVRMRHPTHHDKAGTKRRAGDVKERKPVLGVHRQRITDPKPGGAKQVRALVGSRIKRRIGQDLPVAARDYRGLIWSVQRVKCYRVGFHISHLAPPRGRESRAAPCQTASLVDFLIECDDA